MIIAFSFLTYNKREEENFSFATLERISKAHSEHTFIFIFDKSYDGSLIFSENIKTVVIDYEAKSPLRWLYYYNIKIPKILKIYKADIFISEKLGSLITKLPQILIAPDLEYIHQPAFLKKREKIFNEKFIPKFLKKATTIIVFSELEKRDIIKHFKINRENIEVIYPGMDENLKPIDFEKREIIKEKYAEGNEYFIYAGVIGPQKNLMNLLKAFSAFKKRQRSSMQLIITGNRGKNYDDFAASLRLYRFKKEVKLLENLLPQQIREITASGYAMVLPAVYEISANMVLQAMKFQLPVITSAKSALAEICGEAAIYFDPENSKDIAEKMMMIFKDEELRKELIEKGNEQVKKYSWDKSASAMWNVIEKKFS